MSRRPRLVHEGLPIINSDEHVHSGDINGTSLGTKNDYGAPQTTQSIRSLASIASAAKNTSTTSKKTPHYKLQTRLVVGEDSHNNDEMEMMDADEDEHNHRHNSHQQHYDDSTSKYYGSQDNVVGRTGAADAQQLSDASGDLVANNDGRLRQVFTNVFTIRNRLQ